MTELKDYGKERGLAALTRIRTSLEETGDLGGGAVSTAARAQAMSTDGGAEPRPYPGSSSDEVPQGEEEYAESFDSGCLLVARKESCRSVWCPVCFRRYFVPKEKRRMSRLDWRKTRMLTLTFDRAITGAGEEAYVWYREKKPIGRFIQNLGRAGVKVEDWTCNLEWHDDGTPHFHLLIQVSKSGRAGQIGQELIHRCWPYGRIHEYYLKTESSFLKFLGYFGKTGYLHKNKQHQITLPPWTAGEHWRGKKINRFSSMKHLGQGESGRQAIPSEAEQLEEADQQEMNTYQERLARCGQETNFWLVPPGQPERFIQKLLVPFREVVEMMSGRFVERLGFVLDGPPWLLLQAFRRHSATYRHRGGSARQAENGPSNELVGGLPGGPAPSTAASSFSEVGCESV
jgi:hypothetical protein